MGEKLIYVDLRLLQHLFNKQFVAVWKQNCKHLVLGLWTYQNVSIKILKCQQLGDYM